MLEFLFYAVPALLAAILTIPWRWIFPALLARFSQHPFPAISIGSVVHSALIFLLFAGGLLFLPGIPADENGGEAVVLYIQIGALCAAVSQIAYWLLYSIA